MADGAIVAQAVELAAAGVSYRRIGVLLGMSESVFRRDEHVRAARVAADPDAHSVARRRFTLACRTLSAAEQIDRVELILGSLLVDYALCTTDRRRLLGVLVEATERINHE